MVGDSGSGRKHSVRSAGMSSGWGARDRMTGHRVFRVDLALLAGPTLHDDVVTDRSHLHEEAETVDGQAEVDIRCV